MRVLGCMYMYMYISIKEIMFVIIHKIQYM